MRLEHFVAAQNEILYKNVLCELQNGAKTTCWMWFIFPQIQGLGQSDTSRQFAIDSIECANQYLAHPILGKRLLQCTELALKINKKTAIEIFGCPDWMKFRSSMTLFAYCTQSDSVFRRALDRYFGGEFDAKTIRIIDTMATR
jgi:uncharacterized protein (DUF1810 family)